jgi:precorrin-8X/cobalt-precorrin-8 methylmutase
MGTWNLKPAEIEARSFAIIDQETGAHGFPQEEWSVIRRMIHTSADFDYLKNVRLHPRALASGKQALKEGGRILTDTRMAMMGIPLRRLEPFGAKVDCLISDPRVAERAKGAGTTRAVAAIDLSIDLAVETGPPDIFVIGNAPTALFRLIQHMEAGRAAPALVVGLPVGFVNAAESKAALAKLDIPYITALGRKGGSNVAASVINAVAELCLEESGG